jgi:hypothetical protein
VVAGNVAARILLPVHRHLLEVMDGNREVGIGIITANIIVNQAHLRSLHHHLTPQRALKHAVEVMHLWIIRYEDDHVNAHGSAQERLLQLQRILMRLQWCASMRGKGAHLRQEAIAWKGVEAEMEGGRGVYRIITSVTGVAAITTDQRSGTGTADMTTMIIKPGRDLHGSMMIEKQMKAD